MRICLSLKGTFSVNDIRQGYDHTDIYKSKLNESIESIKNSLVNPLVEQGHTVDIICSTYDTYCASVIESKLSPIKCYKFTRETIGERGGNAEFQLQLMHYKKILELIKESENERENKYDFFIFTRFDLIFIGKVTDWNINYEEFNITMLHLSGNCDDNVWLFPRKNIDGFTLSINQLSNMRGITHEINKYLINNNVKISYIYTITEEDHANNTCYKIYSFNRDIIAK